MINKASLEFSIIKEDQFVQFHAIEKNSELAPLKKTTLGFQKKFANKKKSDSNNN